MSNRESISDKKLIFAGQVLAQVEVNTSLRIRIIDKLILECVLLFNRTFEDNAVKQILIIARQIELFNQKNEVILCLEKAANDPRLSDAMRERVKLVILYVACGEPGANLIHCGTNIINSLTPSLFIKIKNLVAELGEEMTLALETTRQNLKGSEPQQKVITFLTGLSYIRADHYAKAAALLEEIIIHPEDKLEPFISWALAFCPQENIQQTQTIDQYQLVSEKLALYPAQDVLLTYWEDLGLGCRSNTRYEESVECFQQVLGIAKKLNQAVKEAYTLYNLGKTYQAWGKYEQAIAHYQQSRDLNQHLGKETNVADLWYSIEECYREWGKYEQALEAQQQELTIRQQLDDQSRIALAYWRLGRIYQAWGKYEEVIAYHEQSRDLYQHLGKETNVANQWCWIGECYREWGKYQQALEAQQQDLTIRQRLDDQKNIADAYYQLGRIYQAWGKYEEALAHHEQSRDLYATLDLQQELANRLSSLATCYRESKDYTTAIDYYQNSIEIHQALGHNESAARRLRQLSNTERQLAKNCSREEATALLQQAEHHLQQAIQLNTTGDYRENLAYDHIALALLSAEHLRWLPENDASVPDRITQFEQSYTTAFTCFTELGQAVDSAEEALDIARAYLEISPLENLDRAESLAHHSLQTFQDFNRRKLEAAAYKLLGEIYLARAHRQESGAIVTASQFLTTSLHLYREVDLTEKVAEVEQLMTE